MNYIKKIVGANLASPKSSLSGRLVMKMMIHKNDYLERCAVEHCHIAPDDQVLEIGFGHGLGLLYASEKIKDGKVYGVDISTLAITHAEELLSDQIFHKKVQLYKTSVQNIPLNPNCINVAFSCNSFYFWADIAKGCRELHRLIKPGGKLLTVQNIDSVLKRKRSGGFNKANVDFVAYMTTLEQVGFYDVNIQYHTDQVTNKPYQCITATVGDS